MPNTLIPANEDQRLATLKQLGVLDYGSDERFDRITRVMAALFDIPIAMLNMITSDEEVNKSCFGLPGGRRQDRGLSLCSYTIMSDDPLIIEDTFQDERSRLNPQVADGIKIRAYAGIPLKASDGTHPGALCLIDTKPHKFTDEQIALLVDLSAWAEIELNTIKLQTVLRSVHKAQNAAADELEKAEEMNNRIFSSNPSST